MDEELAERYLQYITEAHAKLKEQPTLRDHFIAAALTGFMTNKNRPTNFDPDDDADYCCKLADAMMKARAK